MGESRPALPAAVLPARARNRSRSPAQLRARHAHRQERTRDGGDEEPRASRRRVLGVSESPALLPAPDVRRLVRRGSSRGPVGWRGRVRRARADPSRGRARDRAVAGARVRRVDSVGDPAGRARRRLSQRCVGGWFPGRDERAARAALHSRAAMGASELLHRARDLGEHSRRDPRAPALPRRCRFQPRAFATHPAGLLRARSARARLGSSRRLRGPELHGRLRRRRRSAVCSSSRSRSWSVIPI
jgi:hypothetical protein